MKNFKKLTLLMIISIVPSLAFSSDSLRSTAKMFMENSKIYFSTAFSQKGIDHTTAQAQTYARKTYKMIKPHTFVIFNVGKAFAFEAATRAQNYATTAAQDAYESISHRTQAAQDKASKFIRTAAQRTVDRAIQATKEATNRTADTLTESIESSSKAIVTSTKEAAQSATAKIKEAKSSIETISTYEESSKKNQSLSYIQKALSYWFPKK